MSTNPNEVLVKRSDLLPVEEEDGYFLAGGMVAHDDDDPEELELSALRLLTAAEHIRSRLAREAEREAEEWELEHAVPLARKMHDTFHSFSSNYPEVTDEDLWLRNYKNDNHLVKKWVWTATQILKAQEATSE